MASHYPPQYDDPNKPLYPHGGSYPDAPPPYGLSPHGGPQPNTPYPPGPNVAHMYPGTYPPAAYPPAAYPPGPYPGQPAGGPPPIPPMMPPTMPDGILESGNSDGSDGFAASGGFNTVSLRHAFIRKVYMILAAQLLVTTSIVAVFTFVQPVKHFVQKNQALYWASYAVYFITHMVLVCCTGPRRKHPWNMILLFIFTLALSYMTGTISSFYDIESVFLAVGITAVVCIAVTVFCFQTKVDFTKCRGLFCVLGIVMFVTGIITVIVLTITYIKWLHMLYAALGAIVFTMFLAYHTQLLIGNRKYSIGPDEYIFGALSIYVDVIQIFLFLLQIIGSSNR